ncbi:TauD/TfdA family dioxygenase [Bordetella tumulicola]|uniref:TauD/TfdA family dioxygenase n=1 Tax=Bordetella tumulicola TaxID=1649133 RepID=UPI0039EEFD45
MSSQQATGQGGPQAWIADDVRKDVSWVLRVGQRHIDSLNQALRHAKTHGKPLLEWRQQDFPLDAETQAILRQAIAMTQGRWGMCLMKGFPVDVWTEEDVRMAYWGMGLYMGVGRPQNRASDFTTDVRDAGGSYKVKGGRGYNTNAQLDFHIDSTDVVALLCRRTAKSGGGSKVVSSIALHDEVQRLRPDLLEVMVRPFFHSYQGAQDPSQPPYYRCPVFAQDGDCFAARMNRKNIVAAQRDFPEVPRLTDAQSDAIELLEQLMASEKLCYTMELERGDMQLLNSYVTLHSRTSFEDYDDPDQKRHLLRLWLAVPISQRLPQAWEEYFVDGRPGAVRGGMRGTEVSEAFLAYERQQADALGMLYATWAPKVRKEDMAASLAV